MGKSVPAEGRKQLETLHTGIALEITEIAE
jgi:hypothetical protein